MTAFVQRSLATNIVIVLPPSSPPMNMKSRCTSGISTSPFVPPEQALSFGQGLVYLQPAETRVRRGATLPLLAAHNSLEMMFTIEEDKLTRKGADCELLAESPKAVALPVIERIRQTASGSP